MGPLIPLFGLLGFKARVDPLLLCILASTTSDCQWSKFVLSFVSSNTKHPSKFDDKTCLQVPVSRHWETFGTWRGR